MRYWIIMILTVSCVITSTSVYNIIDTNRSEFDLKYSDYSNKEFTTIKSNKLTIERSNKDIESFDLIIWFFNNVQIFAVPTFCLFISPNQSYFKRAIKALPVFLLCFSISHFFLYQIPETTIIQAIVGYIIYSAILLIIKAPILAPNKNYSGKENITTIEDSKLSEEELTSLIQNMK